MKRSILLIGFLVCSIYITYGQNESPIFRSITEPSPGAAALTKYGDSPPSMSSGIPDISVPVYVAHGHKLSIPIGLRYLPSGRRVDEISGWVGYGWSLHAGGVISRVMRGLPDENNNGFLQYASSIPDAGGPIDPTIEYNLANGLADMVPDLFYINMGPISGKFMFGNDGLPHTIPGGDLQISADISGAGATNTFTVTGADGTVYVFGGNATETSSVFQTKVPGITAYTSSWYLTDIISQDKTDTIQFIYESDGGFAFPQVSKSSILNYFNVPIESTYHTDNEVTTESETFTHTVSNVQFLREIVYSGGKLVFNRSNTTIGYSQKKLDRINVYAYDPVNDTYILQKGLNFTYGSFSSADGGTGRLKLVTFGEEGLPGYSFSYVDKPVPSFGSYSQDHWGFYNGAANTSLLPEISVGGNTLAAGNSREVNVSFTNVGMLTKITTPLGGETLYAYEPNEYWDNTNGLTKTAGGLRIAKIITVDPFSNINDITSYDYVNPVSGKSSGVLLSPYGYSTVVSVDENGVDLYNCRIISAQHSNLGVSSGGVVGYEYVKVYKGNDTSIAGYTINHYNMPADGTSDNFPFVPFNDTSWMRGQLLSVQQYKFVAPSNYQLLKEITNVYNNTSESVEIKGLKVATANIMLNYVSPNPVYLPINYIADVGFSYMSSSTVTTYDPDNPGISYTQLNTTHFDPASGHHQPIWQETTNSDGIVLRKEITYPLDYPSTGVMATMQSKHMVGIPVESKNWVVEGGSKYLTGYSKTEFSSVSGSGFEKIYPLATYSGKITDPVPESTFNSSPSTYTKKQINYTAYDNYGNVIETTNEQGGVGSIIYEQNGNRLIASIQNAGSNQVAYTSFEADDFGNWEVSEAQTQETGSAQLNLGGGLNFSSEQSQTINITYSVTRSVGDIPSIRFTENGGTVITEFLPSSTGSTSVSLTAGTWTVDLVYGANVSAMQVDFSYEYTAYRTLTRNQSLRRTGSNSLSMTAYTSIIKNSLPVGQYTLSYWKRSGDPNVTITVTNGSLSSTTATGRIVDGWQLISNNINITSANGSISIAGSNLIDELRLLPAKAIMRTVNYNTYGQKVDETDANHVTTYFEYDTHHRPSVVRDDNRNIIQNKNYGFANN